MPFTIPLIKSDPHRKALEASPVIKPTARLNPSDTVLYTFPIAVRMPETTLLNTLLTADFIPFSTEEVTDFTLFHTPDTTDWMAFITVITTAFIPFHAVVIKDWIAPTTAVTTALMAFHTVVNTI